MFTLPSLIIAHLSVVDMFNMPNPLSVIPTLMDEILEILIRTDCLQYYIRGGNVWQLLNILEVINVMHKQHSQQDIAYLLNLQHSMRTDLNEVYLAVYVHIHMYGST